MRKQFNSLKLSVTLLPFLLPFFSVTSVKQVDDLPTKHPADEVVLNVDYRDEYVAMLLDKAENTTNLTQVYEVTFYTAGYESTGKRKGDKYYGITASGTKVQEGRTIACPKELEFGTVLYIEGFGERVCEDRGGAIKGFRLDVYVEDLDKAYELGRQRLQVTVLRDREGKGEID